MASAIIISHSINRFSPRYHRRYQCRGRQHATMSALTDPYPVVEHPLCNWCSRRVGGGESDGARATGRAEHYGRSLNLMLLELAMVTPYGDPARHAGQPLSSVAARRLMPCRLDRTHATADGLSCGRIESQAQGGGPVMSDERRAHASARAAGMVGQMKAAEADSRPEVRVRCSPRRGPS